ncbi:MAG: hypothetical protein COA96_16745 [SAR86 cluster bacterium]|uniref:Bacteriophage tail tape measure C-terminal domain-containing protein n=1 Tax=SAR86 cluster bacterium TaxID=2030880 RepID=A0A2A5AHM5_9GAMM|nr:MAG: hypothetical protein COA96_16745 [SAR86 cluster bacterium]
MAKKTIEREVTLSAKLKGTLAKGLGALGKAMRGFRNESKGANKTGEKTTKQVDKLTKKVATLEKRLKRTTSAFGRMGKAMKGTNRLVKTAVGAFAGFLVLRKINSLFNGTVVEMDKIAKASRRLGLSTEFMSRLAFAAKEAGVEFSQSSIAMQRLTRRVAEVANFGRGELLPGLKLLGISPADLKDANGELKDAEQLLFLIADRLQKLDSPSRVLAGFKLFDAEGTALLQLLLNGPEGVRGAFARSDTFGLTLTQQDADRVEKLADSMLAITSAFKGLRFQLVTKFAQQLTVVFDSLAAFIAQIDDRVSSIAGQIKLAFDPLATEESRTNARKRIEDLAAMALRVYQDVALEVLKVVGLGLVDLAKIVGAVMGEAFSGSIRDSLADLIPGLSPSASTQLDRAKGRESQSQKDREHIFLRLEGLVGSSLANRFLDPARTSSRIQSTDLMREAIGPVGGRKLDRAQRRELNELLAEVQAINDEIGELPDQITELQRVVDQELASGTIDSAKKVNAAIQSMRERWGTLKVTTVEGVTEVIAAVDEMGDGAEEAGKDVAKSIPHYSRLNAMIDQMRSKARSLTAMFKKMGPAAIEAVFKLQQFGLGLRARSADVLGQTDAAALLRQQAGQRSEIKQAQTDKLPSSAIAELMRVQGQETAKLKFDQQRAAALDEVTKAEQRHGRVLELNSRRLDAGLITQERAREAIEGQDAALKSIVESTLAKLKVMSEDERFTAMLSDDIEELTVRLEELGLQSDRTFTGGFTAGIRQFRREATDAAAQGRQMADTLTTSLTGGLTDAITGIVDGTKSMSEGFRDMARQVLRDIGTMLVRMAVLRALSAGFGVAGFNSGGLVQGFNTGGFIGGVRGPNRDTRLIAATTGEFMSDRATVDHYGPRFFEGLKQRLLPRGTAQAFSRSRTPRPSGGSGFNQGGQVGSGGGGGTQVLPVLITDGPQLDQLTAAQKTSLIRLIGENPAEFRGAMGI